MSLFYLSQIETTEKVISADLCVIGAGIAGLLLAHRIAKAGRKVVVIESGKERFDQEIQDMNAVEDVFLRYARELNGRFRGLGGSSSRWGGRLIPLTRHDTGERDHLGLPAWPLDVDKLDRYGDEIERLFGVANGSFSELPRRTGRVTSPLNGNRSLHMRWAKCPSFRMCNVSRVLSETLKHSDNIEVWLDSTACDFVLNRDNGILKAIVARNFAGRSLTVRANQYVVSAGTIETTRLMLLMDRAADDRIFSKQAVVGRYFQDHLKIEVAKIARQNAALTNRLFAYRYVNSTRRDLHLDVSQEAQIRGEAGSAFAYIAMDVTNSPLAALKRFVQSAQQRQLDLGELLKVAVNFGLIAKAAYWRLIEKQLFVPDDVSLGVMLCAEQLPNWNNRIALSASLDRFGLPKAQIEWRPMASEERTLRVALAQLIAFWSSARLDKTCPLMLSGAAEDPQELISAKSEACAHPSGTTRMGTHPGTSVVGSDLRCHAVPNVSIVSASVFPTAGSANPTFTIMKLAYYFADNYLATV